MNLKTLVNKINDGIKLILVAPTIVFKEKNRIFIEAYHRVTEFEEGRPDLIAAKYYGGATALDIILKYNGISDPFSIVKDQLIEVPMLSVPLQKYKRPAVAVENDVKQQFVDTKRLSKKDQKRIETLKKKYNKDNILPPNVVPVGKKTYKFEQGKIIFGKQAQSDPVAESATTTSTVINNITDSVSQTTQNLNQ